MRTKHIFVLIRIRNKGEVGTIKIVSIIRKYNNHKLQINPWHRKVEPHNNHETPGRQTKESNQLSFFSIKMIAGMQTVA